MANALSPALHRSYGYIVATGYVSARKMMQRSLLGLDRHTDKVEADAQRFHALIDNALEKTGLTNYTALDVGEFSPGVFPRTT